MKTENVQVPTVQNVVHYTCEGCNKVFVNNFRGVEACERKHKQEKCIHTNKEFAIDEWNGISDLSIDEVCADCGKFLFTFAKTHDSLVENQDFLRLFGKLINEFGVSI